ncbi:MAG: glycosyltransferase family protein [Sedimentisphaerales bacterium]
MARIIYGVAGEGYGHSSRSHMIGQHLIDLGHDVIFAASRKSYSYLRQYFGEQVKEIMGMSLVYDHCRLRHVKTFFTNAGAFLGGGHTKNTQLYENEFKRFRPDFVITDFEPFSAWWAWRNNVPFISIDHEHFLTHCRIEHTGDWFARLNSTAVTRLYYFGAAAYIIINFFSVPTKNKATILAPPVVRPVVCSMNPEKGEDIIIYSTDKTAKAQLLEAFKQFPGQKFVIYGFDEDSEDKNCLFKKTSTEGFLADLAGCRGVIATAGFSLISECLYFKKRMLLLPVIGQYEQTVNSHYIQRLGLGMWSKRLDKDVLSTYLTSLDEPVSQNSQIIWPDNAKFFEILEDTLRKVNCPANSESVRCDISAVS